MLVEGVSERVRVQLELRAQGAKNKGSWRMRVPVRIFDALLAELVERHRACGCAILIDKEPFYIKGVLVIPDGDDLRVEL